MASFREGTCKLQRLPGTLAAQVPLQVTLMHSYIAVLRSEASETLYKGTTAD